MKTGTGKERAGHWPLAGIVRRVVMSTGSFGGLTFACGLALRRTDDTVVVQVEWPSPAADVVALFRSLGVAQLVIGDTMCRAQAVGWDAALCAVVFELHRPAFPELGSPSQDAVAAPSA